MIDSEQVEILTSNGDGTEQRVERVQRQATVAAFAILVGLAVGDVNSDRRS